MSPKLPAAPPYARQPWFALFLVYQLATLPVRLATWTIWFLPRFTRPGAFWTLRQALVWRFTKQYVYTVSRVGPLRPSLDYLTLDESASVKGVWISPRPELVIGEVKDWAIAAGVVSERIPGYWFERNGINGRGVAPPDSEERVVYALHGGAYVRQSAHPNDPTSRIPRGIMKHASTVKRSLTLEYRLSKRPDAEHPHPFPAALIDAIMGYAYLVHDIGFSPSQIVVEGDSAGGNLALALVRYLVENRETLGLSPPSALVLCSPWVDLSSSDHHVSASAFTNRHVDWVDITGPNIYLAIDSFVGPLGTTGAKINRFISPAAQTPEMDRVSYKDFPRTFVTIGGCEVIRDQVRVLQKRMRRDMGTAVVYEEPSTGVHDIIVFPWYEPDRTELLQRIARWIDQ